MMFEHFDFSRCLELHPALDQQSAQPTITVELVELPILSIFMIMRHSNGGIVQIPSGGLTDTHQH